jgi:hypothetical protein
MYYALLHFGRHWKFGIKKAKPAKPHEIAATWKPEPEEPPRDTAVNPGDVHAIRQWISHNDPSLDQIESRAGEEPR